MAPFCAGRFVQTSQVPEIKQLWLMSQSCRRDKCANGGGAWINCVASDCSWASCSCSVSVWTVSLSFLYLVLALDSLPRRKEWRAARSNSTAPEILLEPSSLLLMWTGMAPVARVWLSMCVTFHCRGRGHLGCHCPWSLLTLLSSITHLTSAACLFGKG